MDNEMKNMNISSSQIYKTYFNNVPESNTPFIFLIINFICYLYTFSPKVPINHSTILISLLYITTFYYFCIYILYIYSIHT